MENVTSLKTSDNLGKKFEKFKQVRIRAKSEHFRNLLDIFRGNIMKQSLSGDNSLLLFRLW